MLPQQILDELFNVSGRSVDISLNYIFDELDRRYQCVVSSYSDHDISIVINFKRKTDKLNPELVGDLRIERLNKEGFQICIIRGDELILPVVGNWELVERYLKTIIVHPSPIE